tara:strand:+ start:318 stop:986 length:669 start_codon:yes stop_codon:yes gene_type:complete
MNDSRIEKKFLIEPSSNEKYIKIIKSLPFKIKKKYNSRQVNNIYLDTQLNQSLIDHLDGINKRYKCRVRWYGDFYDFNSPVLEFKMKTNQVTEKKKIYLFNKQTSKFDTNKENFLSFISKQLQENMMVNFIKNHKVSRIIIYKRDYYESLTKNIRFTIDKDLEYKLWVNNKIKKDTSRNFMHKNFNIIEAKYDFKLKYILPYLVNAFKLKSQSYSKFVDYRF